MATLDYALLAEYARIDPAGLVTIVGGSFDRVQASSTRGSQQTYVVMRVLLDESEEEAAFEIALEPPTKTYVLQVAGTLPRNPAAVPVDGRVGVTAGGKGSNIYRARVNGRVLKVMVAPDRDTSRAKHVVTAAWEE